MLEPIWELLHLPRALERPHSMVIWNRANHISCTLHRALLMLKSCSFVIIVLILLQCILVPNLIQTQSEPFRTDFNPVQTSFNRFGPVWTSTKRSDSLLSLRTKPKSFIFIPITIYIFINDFYKYFYLHQGFSDRSSRVWTAVRRALAFMKMLISVLVF